MNIQEFRQKYPQYNVISDYDLTEKLYGKFYSGKMERKDFYKQWGYFPEEIKARKGGIKETIAELIPWGRQALGIGPRGSPSHRLQQSTEGLFGNRIGFVFSNASSLFDRLHQFHRCLLLLFLFYDYPIMDAL